MNTLTKKFSLSDVSILLQIAIPLILTGLLESASPFFGTIFLAQLGQGELAAGALVRSLFFTLMAVIWGILTTVSGLIALKHGEKDTKAVSQILRDGVLLSLWLSVPAIIVLWYAAPIFQLFGQNQVVVGLAQDYLHALAWGVVPDFITLVLLQFVIGIGHTRLNLIFTLLWVPIAIFLNYVFIFGKCGLPALGIAGIGWGVTTSYWITAIGLIIYLAKHKTYKDYLYSALSPNLTNYFKELLQVGLPMGGMYLLEVSFFLALTLMMGLLGEVQLAATQIVMQYLGFLTSVVFSIAAAITVRMGHKIGEGDVAAANSTNYAGIFLAVSFMSFIALCYFLVPEWFIAIDLDVANQKNFLIIYYAKQFFIACAIFQLFEAARISLFGSLRALKDTKFTLIASFIGFWLIPFPISYLLSYLGLQNTGIWWGMAIGAAFSVILLSVRYKNKITHAGGLLNGVKVPH